jgi:fermentation-respiration switch protein FrsA (DUF1100 family)
LRRHLSGAVCRLAGLKAEERMRRHTWIQRAGRLLAIVLALAVAALWAIGFVLIHPAQRTIGALPVDLTGRELIFPSDSGRPLHAWFLPGRNGQGAVLLLHGVRANRLDMLPRARFLQRAGYAVLLIDFQASGESPGDAISFGYREALDASAAVSELRRLAPGESIGVIGTSMGGAAALLAAPALDVDAIVLEQVYPSIDEALRDRLDLHAGMAGRWLAVPLLLTLRPQLGLSPEQLRPIDHIAALAVPKLLIVGEQDRHTRLDESLRMYQQAATPKAMWVVPEARHVDLHRFAGAVYEERVSAFFGFCLRRQKESSELIHPRA